MHLIPKLLISMFFLHAAVALHDVNGVSHKPLELHGQKAAVFFFLAVDCPISNSYAPEINRIIKDNQDKGLDFYIVYCDAKLAADDAKKHVKEFGYTCTALMDPDQVLVKKLGATVTPEAIAVDGTGTVLYQGRIDDWYEDFGKQRYVAKVHDLRDALEEIVSGKKVKTPVTKAVGCPV